MTIRATTSQISFALAMMFVGAAPAHAQIYRWLDGNGAMMYSTDRPADPGALKEFTVIDPVTRPAISTVPADAIAQDRPRVQVERDIGATGGSTIRESEADRGTIVIRDAPPERVPAAPAAVPPPSPIARDPAPSPNIVRELNATPAPIIPPEREAATSTVRESAPAVTPPVTREAETRPRDADVSRQAKPEPTTPSAVARELEATRVAPAPEAQPSRSITIIREPEPPVRPSVAADKPSTPVAATHEPETSAPAKTSSEAAPRRRARVNPNLPEAVQDPCLRSSDPKCYDKNKNAYVPFRGYSPSAAEAREAGIIPPVGATTAAGAGGSVSGGSPPKAPKASDYALPPGSDKPKKLSK